MCRIDPHPLGETVGTARCLDGGCAWEAQPTAEPPGVNVECLAHALATGHDTFAVTVEYVALVTGGADRAVFPPVGQKAPLRPHHSPLFRVPAAKAPVPRPR